MVIASLAAEKRRRLSSIKSRKRSSSGAIAAGGKSIDFDKNTITDTKTGATSTFRRTNTGIDITPMPTTKKQVAFGGKNVGVITIIDPRTGATTRTIVSTSRPRKGIGAQQTQKMFKDAADKLQQQFGLRARVVDINTGKVIDPGQFMLNRSAEERIKTLRALALAQQKQEITDEKGITKKPSLGTGTITAPKLTLREKLEAGLRPKKGESKALQTLKGVGAGAVGFVLGFVDLGKALVKGDIFKAGPKGLWTGAKESVRGTLQDLASGNNYRMARAGTEIAALYFSSKIPLPGQGAASKVANSVTKFRAVRSLTTGSVKVTLDTKGLTQGNKVFTQVAKLRLDQKTKTAVGNVKTKIGKRSFTENVNLKEKAGFYIDTKKGIKIPKTQLSASRVRVKLKEIKSKQLGKDVVAIKGLAIRSGSLRDITTKTVREAIDVTKKRRTTLVTQKTSRVQLTGDLKKTAGKIKANINILKTFKSPTATGKIISGIAQRTGIAKQITFKKFVKSAGLTEKQVTDFLKFIDYDKKIIAGIDRRTRLARALGLRKDSSLLKNFELMVKDGVGVLKIKKGKVTLEGVKEVVNPIYARMGFSRQRLSKLKLNNKGKLTNKAKKDLFGIETTITIPKLKLRVKGMRKLKINGLITTGELANFIRNANKIAQRIRQTPKLKPKLKQKALQKTKQKVKQRVKQKTKQVKKQKPKQKTVTKTKVAQKVISKTITKQKISRVTRAKILKPRLAKPKPKPKLLTVNLDTKLKRGERLAFNLRVRSKGKTITFKTKLPINKALNKLSNAIDKTTSRSAELVVAGITKQKDIKKSIIATKKFRSPKRTNSMALRVVEKRKFAIDTRGEKKGLSIAKALKPKKRKTIKKKKSRK